MTDNIVLEMSQGIARLTFNRPDRLNALNVDTAQSFERHIECVVADSSIKALILRGAGRSFLAGGDLSEFCSSDDPGGVARRLIPPFHRGLERLAASPVISIAAAHGAVAGAGLSLVLCSDLAVGADDASFNLAYAKIGASPDGGSSWALPRIVGLHRAMEIALLSDTITAAEAKALGILNRTAPAGALDLAAEDIATRLAVGSREAQGRTKALLRASLGNSLPEQLVSEADNFEACAETPYFRSAVQGFFAKRASSETNS